MIPRQSRSYAFRGHDCEQAIEPAVITLLRGIDAPFVDFSCLLHAILPAAAAAGWQKDEVRAALTVVVADLRACR